MTASAEMPEVRAEVAVTRYTIGLTPAQADDLYNDVYRMQRDVSGARFDYSLIFALYDALDRAGVSGSGSHPGAST